jgi:hypothetical protein
VRVNGTNNSILLSFSVAGFERLEHSLCMTDASLDSGLDRWLDCAQGQRFTAEKKAWTAMEQALESSSFRRTLDTPSTPRQLGGNNRRDAQGHEIMRGGQTIRGVPKQPEDDSPPDQVTGLKRADCH